MILSKKEFIIHIQIRYILPFNPSIHVRRRLHMLSFLNGPMQSNLFKIRKDLIRHEIHQTPHHHDSYLGSKLLHQQDNLLLQLPPHRLQLGQLRLRRRNRQPQRRQRPTHAQTQK